MGRLRIAALAAAAAGLIAAPTRAAPTDDPPPPASLEVGDVEAWASTYLNRDAWTLITHDTEGAHFTRAHGGTPTSPYLVEAEVRTELFRPVKMGPGWARSGVAKWSVNCATARYAVLSMTIYSHNNLKGELARKPQADRTWMTPIESQVATISVICKAAMSGKLVQPPLAPATPS